MQVKINGRVEQLAPCTIETLVRQRGLKPEALVVEHNLKIIQQALWSGIALREGDTLELLSFVGGG
ncbi:MAG: sulfur carrier protein ThiS [Desulfobacteraceae bacterium]|nr:sulfur carrier protein ThiS [Desulfobacteraceae bacterium]